MASRQDLLTALQLMQEADPTDEYRRVDAEPGELWIEFIPKGGVTADMRTTLNALGFHEGDEFDSAAWHMYV